MVSNSPFSASPPTPQRNAKGPCVFQTSIVGAYVIASGFFSVFGMCVDTLFLCFCESHPHLLPQLQGTRLFRLFRKLGASRNSDSVKEPEPKAASAGILRPGVWGRKEEMSSQAGEFSQERAFQGRGLWELPENLG